MMGDFKSITICPICESDLNIRKTGIIRRRTCKNECFSIVILPNVFFLYIFRKPVREDEFWQMVSYWKENDRYLVELLSR